MAEMAITRVVSEAGAINGMTGSVVLFSMLGPLASRSVNREKDSSVAERPATNRLAKIAEIKQTRKAR